MATESNVQAAKPIIKIVTKFHWSSEYDDDDDDGDGLDDDLAPDDLVPESNYRHLYAVTARLNGKGVCKAWLIKPELVDLDDYASFGLGPGDARTLMHEIFDWPRDSVNRATVNKGVKFLQQFDMDYDYLEEELDDIRQHAWVVCFRNVHVEEAHRRQKVGTLLVRALMQEVCRLAQLQGRPVLAFTKLKRLAIQQKIWDPELPLKCCEKDLQEVRIQASFWESLAFERLNDGHLFAKDLDWLAWSPRARNSALLYERSLAFPFDFNALIEAHQNKHDSGHD